jgi:hypothetical protein
MTVRGLGEAKRAPEFLGVARSVRDSTLASTSPDLCVDYASGMATVRIESLA